MTKTRILFIRPTLGTGGADRVTLNLLAGFDREKYNVSLALMKKEGVLLDEVPSDVNVLFMNKSSLYNVVPTLVKYYRSGLFDVIYSTSSGMSVPLIFAKLLSVKKEVITVVSERSSLERRRLGGLKHKVMFKLKCWMSAKADFIVAVSDSVYSEIEKYTSAKPQQIVRAYNPVIPIDIEAQMDEEVSHIGFKNAKIKIIAVGRLEEVKNFNLLIEIFATLDEDEAELFILGTGPLLQVLENKVKTLGLTNRIHFLGFQQNVFGFLSKADVFVLTSNFEGMPGALIQAMACGLPVVARDCETGPRELITDGVNGYLVAKDDYKKLAVQLKLLISDTNTAKYLGEQAKSTVSKFGGEPAIESYFSFLN